MNSEVIIFLCAAISWSSVFIMKSIYSLRNSYHLGHIIVGLDDFLYLLRLHGPPYVVKSKLNIFINGKYIYTFSSGEYKFSYFSNSESVSGIDDQFVMVYSRFP
jgi:hypothetical protein